MQSITICGQNSPLGPSCSVLGAWLPLQCCRSLCRPKTKEHSWSHKNKAVFAQQFKKKKIITVKVMKICVIWSESIFVMLLRCTLLSLCVGSFNRSQKSVKSKLGCLEVLQQNWKNKVYSMFRYKICCKLLTMTELFHMTITFNTLIHCQITIYVIQKLVHNWDGQFL